ncbi:hypothetical protein L0U85_04865 [Glycomyces sp. L485]|uniref:hypothetical protein n=1 Tax=Glycomyces sp. L485 TaxID=2909235 RepID=UPI001F4A72AF|nr:hypothetical protein [Glycomyces sp. L485]MCH7230195.1 hypothetical protein [Glycomyces sp. L485]
MSEYDEVEPLERRADRLCEGDQVFTAAGRWETVKTVERTGRSALVVTTETGRRSCRWVLNLWSLLPVLPAWRRRAEPKVRFWSNREQVGATLADSAHDIHTGYGLAGAYVERGQGWKVYDLTTAEPNPVAESLSKAKATALVKKIARTRAAELGAAVDFGGAR